MTSSFRSFALALLSLGLLGVLGCAEDNEAAVRDQASKTKGEAASSEPQPQTQEEYAKQQMQKSLGPGGAYETKGKPARKK